MLWLPFPDREDTLDSGWGPWVTMGLIPQSLSLFLYKGLKHLTPVPRSCLEVRKIERMAQELHFGYLQIALITTGLDMLFSEDSAA